MTNFIQEHRQRLNKTQEEVAKIFLTSKSNICNIEKGRRNMSADFMVTGYERCDDPKLLTQIGFELSSGYLNPSPNIDIYDDHRCCIKERLLREIDEALEVLNRIRIDKRPERCSREEIENIRRIASETQDVIFEAQALIDKIILDYHFNPQELSSTRNQRYKMERRI